MFWSQVSSILVLGWSYLAAAAGWAGGVARSVKNFNGFWMAKWSQVGIKISASSLAPKGTNIRRTWQQHGTKHLQNRAKMGPKHPNTNPKNCQNERQNRIPHRTVRWGTPLPCAKKTVKKSNTTKTTQVLISVAVF